MLGKRGGIGRFTIIWLVVFVVLIIISLFVASFFINNFAVKTNKQTSETLSQLQDNFRQQKYDHLTKHLINQNNLNEDYQDAAILVTDNQILYDQSIADGVSFIYTNCNINTYVCEIKDRNYQTTLENQFNLKNIKRIIKTKDQNENQVLILIPIISDNQLVNIPTSSILPTDLEIYQEINNGYKDLFTEYLNKKSPALPSKVEVIKLFLTGHYYQLTKDFVISSVEVGLKLGELNSALQYAEEEYQLLDDSTTEKITKYQQFINKHYPKAQQVTQKENNLENPQRSPNSLFGYGYEDTLFDKSCGVIIWKTQISKVFNELGQELGELRKESKRDQIISFYNNINIQESETSKLLRLNILKIRIAQVLLSSCEWHDYYQDCNFKCEGLYDTESFNCHNDCRNIASQKQKNCLRENLNCVQTNLDECTLQFVKDTSSPSACELEIEGVDDYYIKNQCYLHYAKQDSSLCPRIREDYLREQCENEARANE